MWLASVAGLSFLVLTPPLQVADENRHLNRAYMIAMGDWTDEHLPGLSGNPVPRSVTQMSKRLERLRIRGHPTAKLDRTRWRAEFQVALQPERTVNVPMPSRYSPVAYAPQALAIRLLIPFNSPPIVLLYAARFLNLACWIALVYATLCIAPSHRWSLAFLALTPMSLFTASSVSADVPTNGLAFLLVAVVLSRRVAATPVTGRAALGMWLLATLVGLSKLVYWPLTALLLLIPRSQFGGLRRQASILALVLAGSLLPVLLWYAYAASANMPPDPVWSNPEAQIQFLKSEPLRFLSVLVEAVRIEGIDWAQGFVGVLGWLDTRLPGPVYAVYGVVLLALLFLEQATPGGLRVSERGLLLAVAGSCWLAMMFIAYAAWTPVRGLAIQGFQGRYLIPLVPLVVIALQRQRAPGLARWARRSVLAVSAGTLAIGVAAVVSRYHLAS